MKKFLSVIVILLLIIAALLQFVLPRVVESILKNQIVSSTAATAVDVSLSSTPDFKISFGNIDKVHATAAAGKIGEISFKNLTLDGEKISVDIPELLFPNKDLSPQLRNQTVLKHADKIQLSGIITQDEIQTFIANKDDNFKNPQVSLKPEGATATAQVKFFGRTVDLDIAGTFIAINGDIYFHMTKLNSNSILSRVNVDTFLSDIKVLDSANLPFGMKFESVELREGEAVITASTVK